MAKKSEYELTFKVRARGTTIADAEKQIAEALRALLRPVFHQQDLYTLAGFIVEQGSIVKVKVEPVTDAAVQLEQDKQEAL